MYLCSICFTKKTHTAIQTTDNVQSNTKYKCIGISSYKTVVIQKKTLEKQRIQSVSKYNFRKTLLMPNIQYIRIHINVSICMYIYIYVYVGMYVCKMFHLGLTAYISNFPEQSWKDNLQNFLLKSEKFVYLSCSTVVMCLIS